MSSEQINEQTADIQEPVEQAGGSGPVSFDELEQLQAAKSQAKSKSDKDLEATTAKKEEKPEKVEKKEQKPEKKEAKADKKVEKEPEDEEKSAEPPKKAWKLKYNDKEVELFEDMKIPVKVDGQEIETTFSDLLNGYSGQKAIAQRFQQFNEEKQKYTSERQKYDTDKKSVDEFLSNVFKATQENPLQGLAMAAEFAGLDPVEYQMALAESLSGFASKWTTMSDLEKQHYRLSLENERFRQQLGKEKTKTQSYEALKAIDDRVSSIQSELGISRQQFADAYYELEQAKKAGHLQGDITPDMVKQSLVDKAVSVEASKIVEASVPEMAKDPTIVKTVVEIMQQYSNLTHDDIADILRDSYGKKQAKKTNENTVKQKSVLKQSNPQKDIWSFDQL